MKKLFLLLIVIALLISTSACDNSSDDSERENDASTEESGVNSDKNDQNSPDAIPQKIISVVENEKSEYTLVADEKQGERIIAVAASLYGAIEDITGAKLASDRSGSSKERKEIHLGLTKDAFSVSTYNSLDYDEYSIITKDEKIFITAGSPFALGVATEEFMDRFANATEKSVKLPENTNLSGRATGFELGKLDTDKWNVFDYGNTNVEYGILLPKNYDSEKQYPYFIYVHGHGYGGDETQGYDWSRFQTYLESLGFLDADGVRDCIVIAPHLKVNQGKESWWANSFNVIGYAVTNIPYDTTPPSNNLTDMYTLIRQVGDALNIDESRVYITGASDGGYATWELITRYTDFFTAAIPLCGAGDASKADVLLGLPIYFFHGDADPTVNISAAINMDTALKNANAKKYTFVTLNGLGHGISQAAYAHSGLWEWLFAQTKN